MAQVIILNGTGSVGKSSTARALQAITAEPFLHVAMDAFLDMMPQAMFGHPDGMVFEVHDDGGKPSVDIRTGSVMTRALRGMRRAIGAMAREGNRLIVDEVMLQPGEADEYRAVLEGLEVRFVGLHAPLEVLEARERDRGDREIGLARWQFTRVHQGQAYDLEIDTTLRTPNEVAMIIRDAFRL